MLTAEANDLLGRVQRGGHDGPDHVASVVPLCLLQELAPPLARRAAE